MNILLIMTDQHRADALGCCGNKSIETPNLDWIASQGTVFHRAYTPCPSCIPARACLITGMTPWNVGILGMGRGQGPMGTGFAHTLPGELSAAGYHSQGIGKMHFFPQRTLNGFHHTVLDESGRSEDRNFVSDYVQWFEKNKTGDYGIIDHGLDWNSWMARPYHAPEFLHPTFWTASESIKFLKQRDPVKPFFLKMSFERPHSPYDPPSYYYDLYKDREVPKPYIGDWDQIHHVANASSPVTWRGERNELETMRARRAYYGSITFIDQQIGRVLMYLQNENLMKSTMIIFTSDHGDMLGDHYLWRKTYAYEGSAGIPLIIRLPGSGNGLQKECYQPVAIQDIMPTVLEAAELPVPDTVDGLSLLPLMSGNFTNWREYVHGEHSTCYDEIQEMQFLTDGKMKYIWFPRTGAEQLFNLMSDPGECDDLHEQTAYQSELAKWRSRLIKELEPRNAGLTQDDKLVCQAGKGPIVSPHYSKDSGTA